MIIASKGRFDRAVPAAERARRGLPSTSTVHRDEFMDATLDLWEIPPESATRVGHPAPFPVALPERLINLYTYSGDLVLDPFMGSGTTGVAALRTERHYVGYDTDADYVERARARLAEESERLAAAPAVPRPAVPSEAPDEEDLLAGAAREGRSARELTHDLLEAAGFDPIEAGPKVAGMELTYAVHDVQGRRLLVDLHGSYTSGRAGLRRPDTLWRALGRASVVQLASPGDEVELVMVTTDLPSRSSAAGRALASALASGSGTPVAVVCPDDAGLDVLGQLAKGLRPGDDGWTGGPLDTSSTRS